jgi:hypothetical protein
MSRRFRATRMRFPTTAPDRVAFVKRSVVIPEQLQQIVDLPGDCGIVSAVGVASVNAPF